MESIVTYSVDALCIWGTRREARADLDQQLRVLLKELETRAQASEQEPAEPQTNYRETRAFRAIKERFGCSPTLPALVAMAEIISLHCPVTVKLNREMKRRKSGTYNWFETQIDLVLPILHQLHLFTEDAGPIEPPKQ
jgi:hypothetical protein